MRSAEGAVRTRALDLLARDDALAGIVHGVFDGTPPRASAPYVMVGGAEGRDWGTKDRAGREVQLTLVLVGVGEAGGDGAARGIERVVTAMRGAAGAWTIVGARTIRTRFTFAREGGWRHEMIVRCRCLLV
ncbi:tail completion protein gp17 [Sphingopyxis kveilinensis]|uniref:tail completion protein gp17 n=1 Tax=Sphingopyxis kveilinensis TaxID=3114367 RepID=UPI0030D427E5